MRIGHDNTRTHTCARTHTHTVTHTRVQGLLVYELADNGSLDDHLFNRRSTPGQQPSAAQQPLGWHDRVRIAAEVSVCGVCVWGGEGWEGVIILIRSTCTGLAARAHPRPKNKKQCIANTLRTHRKPYMHCTGSHTCIILSNPHITRFHLTPTSHTHTHTHTHTHLAHRVQVTSALLYLHSAPEPVVHM